MIRQFGISLRDNYDGAWKIFPRAVFVLERYYYMVNKSFNPLKMLERSLPDGKHIESHIKEFPVI
jgi:hypothetical protein